MVRVLERTNCKSSIDFSLLLRRRRHLAEPHKSRSHSLYVLFVRVCVLWLVSVSISGIRAICNALVSFGEVNFDWKLGSCRSETLVG